MRIFFETSDISYENMDTVILILGAAIVVYTLIALFYTYKYRSGLGAEEKVVQLQTSSKELEKEKRIIACYEIKNIGKKISEVRKLKISKRGNEKIKMMVALQNFIKLNCR